jgi:hypothetical protein
MAHIPFPYIAFFHWIEPVATLAGAFYAFVKPQTYLQLTQASSAPGILGLPTATEVALRQLGNLYFCFALNEALVLRATTDLRVWRTLLLGLLIADFGHLYSCLPLGLEVYYDVARWNIMDWGSIAFVYCGATTRICFLAGIGMSGPTKARGKARSIKAAADETISAATPSPEKVPAKTPTKSTRKRKNKSTS